MRHHFSVTFPINVVLSIFALLVVVGCSNQVKPDHLCQVPASERTRILSLSFADFDQNADDGWRPYYSSKCYSAAAELIVEYLEATSEREKNHYILPFHAGQMFALNGENSLAIQYIKRGYSDRESSIIDWNAFVDAHLAFLERDYPKLVEMRQRIDQQPALSEGPGTPDWAVGK